MTAREYHERVTCFSELEDFLNDEGDSYLDDNDICYHEDLDSAIDDDVGDYVTYSNYGWSTLYENLSDVSDMDCGEGWYRRNGPFDYSYLDYNDFDDIKEDVYERYLSNGWFEEDDEEESDDDEDESEQYVDPEDLIPVEPEDVPLDELVACGVDTVLKAREERIENQKRKEAEETAKLEHMLFSAAFA